MNLIRQSQFDEAIATARQHIPIVREVCANPSPFAIVDKGDRYAVYDLDDFPHGGKPGGFLPPKPITGDLVATVDLSGIVTLHP